MDDLTGFVTAQSEDWTVLTLPAIAEADEWVQEGDGLWHPFKAGEALQPDREPLEVVEELRRQLGSVLFAAQYQQRPVPESGVMIKPDWVRRYKTLPPCTARTRIEQSWDTAAKVGPENDWSVCSTWQVEGDDVLSRRRNTWPLRVSCAEGKGPGACPRNILLTES